VLVWIDFRLFVSFLRKTIKTAGGACLDRFPSVRFFPSEEDPQDCRRCLSGSISVCSFLSFRRRPSRLPEVLVWIDFRLFVSVLQKKTIQTARGANDDDDDGSASIIPPITKKDSSDLGASNSCVTTTLIITTIMPRTDKDTEAPPL
jgi:hypothetical protein